MGVSQITASDEIYNWRPRKTFLPLVTAGQRPIFLDDTNALWALTDSNFDGNKIVILPPEAKSFVTVTNATATQILNSHIGTQRLEAEVESPAPALVVIAQTFYHDWHASVDGHNVPLLRANYGFQAVEIPEGRHTVQLTCRDQPFEIGAACSIVSWLVCLGCLAFRPAIKSEKS